MFRLRQEHLEAFERLSVDNFERGVIKHLREMFAEQVREYSDEELRERIRACVPRAAAYGLTTQYQVLCFVDATYLLGEHFDTDPQQPWCAELLNSPLRAEEKADCLLESACSGKPPVLPPEEVS